jgi:hypothetical protein
LPVIHRHLRSSSKSVLVVALMVVVVLAVMFGFDVINGGYSQADIQIGL